MNIESGYCPVEEYTAFEEHRCLENEFQIEELYMMMFSLNSLSKYQQAAKKPSRVTDLEEQDSGLYLVSMDILNDDLHPDCSTQAMFRDGYWQREGSRKVTVGGHAIKTAYMKTYYGEFDTELDTFIKEVLPASPIQEEILTPVLV